MRYEVIALVTRSVHVALLLVICWGLVRQVWNLRSQKTAALMGRIVFWVAWAFLGWLWISADRIRILSVRDVIDDWPSILGLWFANIGLVGLLVTLHWDRLKPFVQKRRARQA